MATIENRSRVRVTVRVEKKDLTRTFAYTRKNELNAYLKKLEAEGHEPKLESTMDRFAIRIREAGQRTQCLYASTAQEAVDIKNRIEAEHRTGFFVDYTKARSVTFADLMIRYLREVSPRHKGFETEGYALNAILADAGLERVDMAQAYAEHKNPHASLAGKVFRKPSGKQVRTRSEASCFVHKRFSDVVPEDFNDYIDDRCQTVQASTVDREVDLFSAICKMAINTWRIPLPQSPMNGTHRPKYFNERDRRLKGDEEARLLNAAYEEDSHQSIEQRLEELMSAERAAANEASTIYQRKGIVKAARAQHLPAAEASYTHTPWLETFIQFQLMTGARRSETMSLTWVNIDFEQQTAFIPETKNGRPRKLALRSDLIALLKQLPRDSDTVFAMSVDALRKAWTRICGAAGLVGDDELRIHDLRHEAISRVADAGSNLAGGISLVDLQAFSGHRDTRMLLRYTHLCMPAFAKRLDEAFTNLTQSVVHRGRRRLKKQGQLTMKELANGTTPEKVTLASNVVKFRPRTAA